MTRQAKEFLKKLSTLWVVGAFVVGMFYTEDKYFNMLEAKAACIDLLAVVFVCMSVLAALAILYDTPIKECAKDNWKKINGFDIAVAAFVSSTVFANLTTAYPREAFWGSFGWRVGTFYFILMGLVYAFLHRYAEVERKLLYGIAVFVDLEFLWIVCNGFYLDFLGFHKQLAAKDYGRYVGSVGNTNWYVGFLSLVLPFLFYGAIKGQKRWQRISCYVGVLLGSMSVVTIHCDGIFPALFVLTMGSLYYGFANGELTRLWPLYTLFWIGVGMVWLLSLMLPMVTVDGLAEWILNPLVWGTGIGVCLLFYLISKAMQDKERPIFARTVMIGSVLAVAGGILYVSGHFSNSWGTNRGYIWKKAVQIYSDFPLLRKLFGGGANCFGLFYRELTGSDWVRNAHNEFLEYLVCTGLFGLLSYVAIFVCAIKEKTEKDPFLIAGKLAIMAYMAQAFFNNPQALNGAIFYTILAMYRRKKQSVIE